ncbi:MAG: methionyl-tRNA formyltransferase [Flavobacteriales bacterium]
MSQRIVFMGTPEFAVHSLNALLKSGVEVAAVVTAMDKPAGRGRQVQASAVKLRAVELGLPLLQPERLKDPGFHASLLDIGADLFVVVAFRMLPESVWTMPPLGTINLHASLLPQYRGAAPINWAVINGERITGATTFFIRHEIDTGDILMQEELSIGTDDTAGEVHDRMAHMGGDLLARTVQSVLAGTASSQPQRSSTGVVLHAAPKLNPLNCRIDWNRTAQRIHDHVRGLNPYPGAWTQWIAADRSAHFKVLRTAVTAQRTVHTIPGSVEIHADGLRVSCADSSIELLEVQAEGKRRMTAAEFARGLDRGIAIRLQ